ncbi:MAG TPA: hypothetical protein VG167_06190 [Verrucomicrobiae bacterium]|nr:hypothetical protein [Verrucomicrobiae bacterium]
MGSRKQKARALALLLMLSAGVAAGLAGCVSKARAKAEARAAFVAGEQQAMNNVEQLRNRGDTVTVLGDVKTHQIPWTTELTLAKAVVDAGYIGAADPTQILVVREGRATPYDPKQLLKGEDVPLQARDVVVLR